MQEHMEIANECVHRLTPFFKAVLVHDHAAAKLVYKEIRTLENKADVLKKKLRLQMPKGLFMPVARRDLLELLLVQDQAANQAKDISGLITGRKMEFPEPLAALLPAYVKRCEDAGLARGLRQSRMGAVARARLRGALFRPTELAGLDRPSDALRCRTLRPRHARAARPRQRVRAT